jgi:single-stranded DNA-binding protein
VSLTINFSGKIQKAEFRQAGEKSVCQVSVCEKKYNKDKNAEPEYDWIEASIWEPPEFMVAKLKKGNFITFSGSFSTRKYTDKAGVEKKNMECRCDTRNVTVVDAGFFGEREAPKQAFMDPPAGMTRRPAAPAADDLGEAPF